MKPVAPTIRTRPLAEETEGVTVMLGSDEFVLWFLLYKGQVLVCTSTMRCMYSSLPIYNRKFSGAEHLR